MFYKPLSTVATEYLAWATDPNPRVPTGYPILDSRTNGGAAYGEVVLFNCRSQVGKTTFGLNVIANNIGRPCVFFSLEMHGRYLIPRLAAIHTGTPTEDIERQMRATGRSPEVERTVNEFGRLAIIDKPAMTLKEMGQALEEVQQTWGQRVELVVIDFLELMGGIPSLNKVEKIDDLTQKIKNFARQYDVVVLLLHQVSRTEGGGGELPLDITSGRYGGEVSADYVLGAFRPCLRKGISQEEYLHDRWLFFVQFLKTRGGSEIHPEGELHCFNPHTMRISYPYPAAQFSFAEEGDVPAAPRAA
jgi:KaiC/GvpD/RAD55 family RecA-like ATPase